MPQFATDANGLQLIPGETVQFTRQDGSRIKAEIEVVLYSFQPINQLGPWVVSLKDEKGEKHVTRDTARIVIVDDLGRQEEEKVEFLDHTAPHPFSVVVDGAGYGHVVA